VSVEHIYREIRPPAPLREHLLCLWTETTSDRADLPPMRILPDGCIDVVWTAGQPPRVAGPATTAVFPGIPPGSTLVAARFRPGMAATVLGVPAYELADADVPLAALWGDRRARPGGRFDESRLASDGLDELQALLLGRLEQVQPGDRIVTSAADVLIRDPEAALGDLADRTGLSDRQLRRRFEAAIGYGPKTFQRIARFRRWLGLAEATPQDERRLVDLAAEAGYADQAHLTREVTRLAGLPPSVLLNDSG